MQTCFCLRGGIMERILIIGCSGSGKSTLARHLGEKLKFPVIHLDKIWWTGDWENVTREEFDSVLAKEIEKPRWIIDGNYSRTMEMRLAKCDTIIYLDFNRITCMLGMIQRVTSYYGRVRPDMGGNCRERFDWEFIQWIWSFNKKNRERNYRWLEETQHAKKIVLKNRRQVRKFLYQLDEL